MTTWQSILLGAAFLVWIVLIAVLIGRQERGSDKDREAQ